MDNIQIIVKKTDELSPKELLNIFEERVRVFVVEQNCAYQEVDIKDYSATHVILKSDGKLVAYARIVSSDNAQYVSFGRVLVPKKYRNLHLGRKLIETTLAAIKRLYPDKGVKIAGQEYLKDFYSSFGFKPVSEVYLEDGLPHIDMILENDNF
ncbi:GNAT family N-acetyltransferase [Convivina intestini]|uniref:ElaA protein n=1 Tax=Convivina intestini TaxID=1505726 RepID=A0A2U1DEJ2_9LACO|nr:GNAT family N-acetyltransferase [Convivina intestini]PVY86103.1 ElaA protein [Convivina intestini]CAH1851468.1 Protein ElaA [Convivina intestini]CAH1853088.1 Protein ElaA [Convivina intestini]SDB80818.1 ElaA protein [Leuconostocaceae bacterium R-53105]